MADKDANIRLDGNMLVDRLQRDGRLQLVSKQAARHWRLEGMNIYIADKWCIQLGYHPFEVFGSLFYQEIGESNG